mmetsp:Transcript_5523/g.9939  ORF Transcript_5523/g.9939 Transcript_5523/m.9939 type:complete len:461 (-) Transcript_5523:667-2049(-)
MSQRINRAVNQVRHTNIAVVRLRKKKKQFEIACYPNKINDWRKGLETNRDNVLQSERVYENVGKGLVAKKKDMEAVFGTSNVDEVLAIILAEGQAQISELERQRELDSKLRNIASIVADKCVNPMNKRPYPVSTIEQAMKETLHYAVATNRSAKQQALEVMRKLGEHIPLTRAQMSLRVQVTMFQKEEVSSEITRLGGTVTKTDSAANMYVVIVLIDPGHFGKLSAFLASMSPPGTVEVKDFSVQEEEEADVEVTRGLENSAKEKQEAARAKKDAREDDVSKVTAQVAKATLDETSTTTADANSDKIEEGSDEESDPEPLIQRPLTKREKKRLARREAAKLAREQGNDKNEAEEPPTEEHSPQNPASATTTTPVVDAKEPPSVSGSAGAGGTASGDGGGLKCNTCRVNFGSDREAMKLHYKTNNHRVNLKLKAKGLPTLSEEEFELLGPEELQGILTDYS